MKLKPCPFCGNRIKIVATTYGGIGYQLYHDVTDDPTEQCPIAGHEGEGEMGTWIYDTREEAAAAWNRRVGDDLMERMEDDGK